MTTLISSSRDSSAPAPELSTPALCRPELVGILNVTPDSFFDGGRYTDPVRAIDRGAAMFAEGAAWVDVGGISTRPGSAEIPAEEELSRVAPVIRGLSSRAPRGARISVDTYRARVAETAMACGASAVNDVSGFTMDPAMCAFAASTHAPVVINHMKGTPETMQSDPRYGNLWDEIISFFEDRMARFVTAGGSEQHLILDPGVGFGKTAAHNREILRGLGRLRSLGRPVFLGCSRKSFIAALSSGAPPADRLPGSLAAAAWAAVRGVDYLRVHDVAETAQFLTVFLELNHA